MNIKEWLKEQMEARGLNSATLADAIGENQPTIYRILSGETKNPRLNIVKKLEGFFKEEFIQNNFSAHEQDVCNELSAVISSLEKTNQIVLLEVAKTLKRLQRPPEENETLVKIKKLLAEN